MNLWPNWGGGVLVATKLENWAVAAYRPYEILVVINKWFSSELVQVTEYTFGMQISYLSSGRS